MHRTGLVDLRYLLVWMMRPPSQPTDQAVAERLALRASPARGTSARSQAEQLERRTSAPVFAVGHGVRPAARPRTPRSCVTILSLFASPEGGDVLSVEICVLALVWAPARSEDARKARPQQ